MTIACPTPQWPSGLLEVGPEQDRSVLLRSVATIAGAAYAVIAIRVDPISMSADLRCDLPWHAYNGYRLQEMLDEISVFAEITDRALVHLAGVPYVMLMMPAEEF
jgi:hypothetical protein